MSSVYLAVATAFFILGTAISSLIPNMHVAYAHELFTDNPDPHNDSITANPDPAPKGGVVNITICASIHHDIIVLNSSGQPNTLGSQPLILTPAADTFLESAHTYPLTIPAGKCHSWSTATDFSGLSTMTLGAYGFFADTNVGEMFVPFDVPFFVLPESPIGVIAIIGSSLGALGTYAIKLRRNKVTRV